MSGGVEELASGLQATAARAASRGQAARLMRRVSWSRVRANRICWHIWNRICGIAMMLTFRALVHKSLGAPAIVIIKRRRLKVASEIWYNVGKIFPKNGGEAAMLEKNLQSLNEVIIGSSRSDVAKLLLRLKHEGRENALHHVSIRQTSRIPPKISYVAICGR